MIPIAEIASLASLAASGIMSARNNADMEDNDRREAARRRMNYIAEATENPMFDAKNAQLLNEASRTFDDKMKTQQARSTVIGGTPEADVAQQKVFTDAYADVVSNIAAGEQVRRNDALDKLELNEQKAYEQANRRKEGRNTTYANLVANAGNAIGNLSFGGDSTGDTSRLGRSRVRQNKQELINNVGKPNYRKLRKMVNGFSTIKY